MAALDLVADHLHQHRRGRHGIAVHQAHIPAQVAGITAEIQGPALHAIDKVADETGQMEHGHQRKVAEGLVEVLGYQPLLLVKDGLQAIDVHLAGGEVVLLAQHHTWLRPVVPEVNISISRPSWSMRLTISASGAAVQASMGRS